jgi:hypothetical protein
MEDVTIAHHLSTIVSSQLSVVQHLVTLRPPSRRHNIARSRPLADILAVDRRRHQVGE